MVRNIELNGTNKIITVQKIGKKTVLEQTTLNFLKNKAESTTMMILTPILMPLVMSIAIIPSILNKIVGIEASDSVIINMIASMPSYISMALIAIVGISVIVVNFKLVNFFSRTESSNIFLSSENKNKFKNEDKNYRRIVVNENLMKHSASSIAQKFIAQAYPEMTIENYNTEIAKNIDKSFSNIFNQNAA